MPDERRLIEELDDAVEEIVRNPDAPMPRTIPGLAAILRIAADLRGLPRDAFRTRLRAELQQAAGEVPDRATPSTSGSTLTAHDLRTALSGLSELAVSPSTTEEEAGAAVRELALLNQCVLGLTRFSGRTPWERHPDGDELLHVLDGEVEITVLTDDGPVDVHMGTGSVFVCPRGLWHCQRSPTGATLLFATPARGSEVSWAEDPRSQP
jgi:mannose-6-phosphate isomerase-like protein (cupin superfamily)